MNALFRGGCRFKVITCDGLNSDLLEEKEAEILEDDGTVNRYLMPAHTTGQTDTDGASIPTLGRLLSIILGIDIEHYGKYWPWAVWHDFAFRRKLKRWDGSTWVDAYSGSYAITESRANAILRAGMWALDVNPVKRELIYNALVLFGKSAWDEDGKLAT